MNNVTIKVKHLSIIIRHILANMKIIKIKIVQSITKAILNFERSSANMSMVLILSSLPPFGDEFLKINRLREVDLVLL